jgi:hypothetical protein
MFNPIEPGVDEPSRRTRRRPSFERAFFWSYTVGIPVVAVGAGIALLIASSLMDGEVQAYRSAGPCPSAPTTIACYTLVPGTLTKVSISHGKSGDTANMTLQLPDGPRSTWAKTSWQQEDALRVGAQVQVKFYKGALTAVYLGSNIGIQTKDNPIYKQSDLRLGAVLIPVLGLVIAGVTLFTLRGRKKARVGSIAAIDPTLPIAEKEKLLRKALLGDELTGTPSPTTGSASMGVMLPFTLRPHPIPTGRPWWVGLIVAGLAVPMLVLRMRTPAAIAQVVIGVAVVTMLAAVVLHWLYRNRRQLLIDDFGVRRVNLFGFSRVVPRADIARVASPIVMNFGMAVQEQRLLFLDATGRCLMGLKRYYPTDVEVAQVAGALRVPLDGRASLPFTTTARLRRDVPGSVSWPEAHPFILALLLIPSILAATVGLIFVLNGLKWSS